MGNVKGTMQLTNANGINGSSINDSPVIFSHQKRIIKLQPFPSMRGLMHISLNADLLPDQFVIRNEPENEFTSRGAESHGRAIEPFNAERFPLEEVSILEYISGATTAQANSGIPIAPNQIDMQNPVPMTPFLQGRTRETNGGLDTNLISTARGAAATRYTIDLSTLTSPYISFEVIPQNNTTANEVIRPNIWTIDLEVWGQTPSAMIPAEGTGPGTNFGQQGNRRGRIR